MTIDDYYNNRFLTDFAERLAQVSWIDHPELARLVQSDIARAFVHTHRGRLGRPPQLTHRMMVAIRRRAKAGERVEAIANDYDVSRGTIYRVLGGVRERRPYRRRTPT